MIHFEKNNVEAYALVLRIEILLRELLQVSWCTAYGEEWRKRLPGPLLQKIKISQTEEQKPHFDFVRLGPLYYLTFGELLEVLSQKPSKSAVDRIGGACIVKQIENICAPRNAICHSRPVTANGLQAIRALHDQLISALTEPEARRLASNPDVGLERFEFAERMKLGLKCILETLHSYPARLEIPEVYRIATQQYWWLDDSLAGFQRDAIEKCVAHIQTYNTIPSGVGCAWNRQQFCYSTDIRRLLESAMAQLETVN